MESFYCIFLSIDWLVTDAFNGLSMVGHLKLAHLDLQSLNSFVFRGLRHVQVSTISLSRFYTFEFQPFFSSFFFDQLLSIQESDLGVIKPNIFTNMTNIGRVSFTNNKIDGIDSLKLTADNRVRQFHFIGNHVLNLSHGRTINIKGKSVYIITEFRVLNHKWQNCPAV